MFQWVMTKNHTWNYASACAPIPILPNDIIPILPNDIIFNAMMGKKILQENIICIENLELIML